MADSRRIVVAVLTLGAVAVFVWAVWTLFNPALSVETSGTITSIRKTQSNSACCPVVVEYTDDQGIVHELESVSGGGRDQSEGDSLTVYYNPDDPESADTGRGRMLSNIYGGLIALILAALAFIVFASGRKKKPD